MNINSFKILVASFCLMMFFVSNNAEARKGIPIVIYSTDDDIIEIKDAVVEDTIFLMGQDPAEVNMAEAKSNMPANLKVGMMHSRFALFWMNVWTWDGQIVLFTDDTYYTVGISQAEAIAKYGKPFSYTYPTLALIAGGGLGIFLLFVIFGQSQVVETRQHRQSAVLLRKQRLLLRRGFPRRQYRDQQFLLKRTSRQRNYRRCMMIQNT